MDQQVKIKSTLTPEEEAAADAAVAEYERMLSAGEGVQQDYPFDDFTDVLERCERQGIKAKPWGWWLEENKQKEESPS